MSHFYQGGVMLVLDTLLLIMSHYLKTELEILFKMSCFNSNDCMEQNYNNENNDNLFSD